MKTEYKAILEIEDPNLIEVIIKEDRKTLWIDVDGECRVRCRNIKELTVEGGDILTPNELSSKLMEAIKYLERDVMPSQEDVNKAFQIIRELYHKVNRFI